MVVVVVVVGVVVVVACYPLLPLLFVVPRMEGLLTMMRHVLIWL